MKKRHKKIIKTSWSPALTGMALLWIFLLTACGSGNNRNSQGPATINPAVLKTGANWQLFIDDYWISESRGIVSTLHQPEKYDENPIITGDVPWEENPYCFGTVIYDEEDSVFKFWYQSYNHDAPVAERTPVLYATSADGIRWERPNLGLFEFRGSKNNNIVMQNYGYHDLYSPSVIKDTLEGDPARRYKMIWWDFPLGEQGYQDDGMCVAFSHDGIHWEKYENNPVLHAEKSENSISDVMAVMRDARSGKYVAYTKGWAAPWPSHRQIVRTESSDFIHWSKPEVVISHTHDTLDPQSYGMTATQFGDNFIGLLHSYQNPGDETIDVQLAVSHDNQNWQRVANRQTFLPLGPNGSWDDGMIFCAPAFNHGEKTLLYYSGWDGPHDGKNRKSGIGLATLRLNGFVSLDAQGKGEIITEKLINFHGPLLVNVDAAGGSLRAELLDSEGKPLPGYTLEDCIPITADDIAQHVTWKNNDFLPVRGEPVRLRFELVNASLYGFYAGTDAERVSKDFTDELPVGADKKTIAEHLVTVREQGGITRALALHYSDLSTEQAYEIQMKMLSQLEARGERLAGWKMGGASRDNFNPLFGFMLTSGAYRPGDVVGHGNFADGYPLIEAEIGFVLKKDLPGPVTTMPELLEAIEGVGGFSELINIRVKDAKGGIKATTAQSIADGLSNGGFIRPSKVYPLNTVDFNDVTAIVRINGRTMATGDSKNYAFLDAVLFLANELPKYGRHLRAGDVVITGSILTPPPAAITDKVEIDFSKFEPLKISFE